MLYTFGQALALPKGPPCPATPPPPAARCPKPCGSTGRAGHRQASRWRWLQPCYVPQCRTPPPPAEGCARTTWPCPPASLTSVLERCWTTASSCQPMALPGRYAGQPVRDAVCGQRCAEHMASACRPIELHSELPPKLPAEHWAAAAPADTHSQLGLLQVWRLKLCGLADAAPRSARCGERQRHSRRLLNFWPLPLPLATVHLLSCCCPSITSLLATCARRFGENSTNPAIVLLAGFGDALAGW